MTEGRKKLLLFGGSGQIAQEVAAKFGDKNWDVCTVARTPSIAHPSAIIWDVMAGNNLPGSLGLRAPFDAVCWAQGANLNDSIYEFNKTSHQILYEANVLFILESLSQLLRAEVLVESAKLCIVSSIWQEISRQNKLSYAISKSALRGLVLSLANDLAEDGYLVNAVLPGALDTPMTRSNLSEQQIRSIEGATKFNKLATLGDVASTIFFLCSEENSGVTGQFLKVDLGFSDVRNI
ncbi:SDR family oxidoreductase [Polynucleobacter sp. AP-Kolm-20A-A1]|uniref:SDR family oxidoreductase n=1 Tax=Polynucleobacter sp. AP-Kolm-20A-A1 TaxID=2081041 RepID=UPI001BFE73BD|nr:SDR family oxidoreductase [Polynucleobacter sp. AP-Kolm-20A-A1]QWE20922.1 SDR family oxidoreductase [Polynucleobacter sp. AP-Kolm-20A-A1]